MQDLQRQKNDLEALKTLFHELNILVYDDVLYYTRVRNKHRRISAITRFFSWVLGAAGLLVPLIIGANPDLKEYSGWGYPLLAAAGAILLVNRLFGSTKGHVRYVTAQLALEHLITVFNLRWMSWLSSNAGKEPEAIDRIKVFKLFNEFIQAAYKIVQDETTVWGIAVMQDLDAVGKQLTGNGSPGANSESSPTPPRAPTAPANGTAQKPRAQSDGQNGTTASPGSAISRTENRSR
jgi:hypothetical protein